MGLIPYLAPDMYRMSLKYEIVRKPSKTTGVMSSKTYSQLEEAPTGPKWDNLTLNKDIN